ncbi:MAG: hypothetical protein II899_04360 [Bacteroidales bacterium]|nr:hypothetical protein [Bacteroidales bacterium]
MKYVRIAARIMLIISVLVIAVLAMVQMPKRACSKVEVVAHTQNESVVLGQAEVEKMLATAGIETVGKKIKEVDLAAITALLKENPYVKEINVVHFAGSRLVIDYTLRDVLLHVYTSDGDQYFLDGEGHLIPYTGKMKDYLFIANGNLHQHYKKGATAGKELKPIVELANMLNADDFHRAQFRQIYRNKRNQLELVSTIGNQVVLFGDMENAAEKLDNLRIVYKEGLSRKGYDQYAMLDARFKNRIIAQHR